MIIGLVSPYSFSTPGGVQNHVLGLGAWLRSQGHTVRIAGPGEAAGVTSLARAVPIAFNGSLARIGLDPRVRRRLRDWSDGLDLVHVHEPLVPLVGMQALRLGVASVATFHAATSERVHRALTPLSARLRDTDVIAVSEVAARAPRAWGLRPHIIGNGIDVASFGPPVRTRRPHVCFVGRCGEPRKGFSTFADAVPLIRASLPDVRIVVVGDGCDGVPGVEFLGAGDDAVRNAELAAATVLVAPNSGSESFGIVLLEALASGADVVASDIPAFRALLTDEIGPVARLIPPGSAAALAAAVISSVRLGPSASAARRATLTSHFDWDEIGHAVMARYESRLSIA